MSAVMKAEKIKNQKWLGKTFTSAEKNKIVEQFLPQV